MKPYTLQSKKVKKKKNLSYVKDTALCEKKTKKKTMLLGNFKRPLVTIENEA